jgi:hypothetical protein
MLRECTYLHLIHESGFSQFDQKIDKIMLNLNPSLYLTKNQWAQIKTHKSMFFIEFFLLSLSFFCDWFVFFFMMRHCWEIRKISGRRT